MASWNVGLACQSLFWRMAMIRTGMPTQWAWIGGMFMAEPPSSTLAWKASVIPGPPLISAHWIL